MKRRHTLLYGVFAWAPLAWIAMLGLLYVAALWWDGR